LPTFTPRTSFHIKRPRCTSPPQPHRLVSSIADFCLCAQVLTIPFSTLSFKSTVNDQAQALNEDLPLSQGRTKMASRRFAKIKQQINGQCRKTAGVLHRRAETKTEDAFEAVQDSAVLEPIPACANILEPSTLVDEPTTTGTASPLHCGSASSGSVPTEHGTQVGSSTGSASSSETDLTVYSAATATKPEDQLTLSK
jgi:hypothetical protein